MQTFVSGGGAARARGQRPPGFRGRPTLLAALALACLALAAPAVAGAVVNEPPALPHSIIVFPQRDFVSGSGFAPGEHIVYNVIRNGVTIATSDPVLADSTGLAEVNHPGGGCWLNTTPDLLPGDQVRSTVQESGAQDQTTTADVTAERPVNPAAGTVVIHGTAQTATGGQIPIAQLEQRLVSGKDLFAKNGRRTLRAPGDGTFAYDGPTTVNWTATYTGLSAADVTRALAAESRGMWLGVNPGTLQESTIYESPGAPGPAAPCTAPLASNAVTGTDHTYNGQPTVNAGNVDTALGLSGVAQADATSVTVKVADTAGNATAPVTVTLPGGTAGQTWTATVPAAQVGALSDGTLTASMTYTTPGGTLAGASLTLGKDTIAPAAPGANPPGGTYTATQSVVLFDADSSASILYTTNSTTPASAATADGVTKLYGGAIAVNSSQTIKALAVDASGNPSTVSTNVYTLIAAARLTPSAIDFGSVAVGTASAGQTVTMANVGAADMTVSAVAFTGANPADFARGVNTCTGATLRPGESCTVASVRFQPQASGDRSAALTFTDSAPGSPHAVALSGTGTGPGISATPNPLSFDPARAGLVSGSTIGGTATSATLMVRNTGNANLSVGTATIATSTNSGDFAITSNGCAGATVVPAGTCTIALRFAPRGPRPAANQTRSATLNIPSNAPASPTSVTLSGTATP